MLQLGDSTGKAYLWDIKTQSPNPIQNLQHMSPIKDVNYNQTVGNLITSGQDGVVNFFDPKSNQIVNKITYPGKI